MKRITLFLAAATVAALGIIAACGDDSTSGGTSTDAGNTKDATTGGNDSGTQGSDAGGGTDSGSSDMDSGTTTSDAGSDGSSGFTLEVQDYLNWCNVTVDDAGPSTLAVQTFSFPPDASVSLSGDTASAMSFVWGYWYGTAGDDGGPPHDTNKTTSVWMTGNKKIQACCPTVGAPTTPCPPPM